MNFELMNLPVLTGLSSIEQYKPKIPINVASVRFGMPCLIINKKICNLNGIPFGNDEFQSDFKNLSERIYDCSVVAIGRIIDETSIYSGVNMYTLNTVHKITYNSKHYSVNKDNIAIELHDLHFNHTDTISFKTRFGLLSNIVKSMAAIGINVQLPANETMEVFNKDSLLKMIKKSAEIGNDIFIRDLESLYIGGNPELSRVRSFILNPFEEVEDEVEDVELTTPKELKEIKKITNIITKIKFKTTGVTVDYSKEKEYTRYALTKLMALDRKIKFESVIMDGKYYFSRPL